MAGAQPYDNVVLYVTGPAPDHIGTRGAITSSKERAYVDACTGHGCLSGVVCQRAESSPLSAPSQSSQRGALTAPESFTCQAQARTSAAGTATNFRIQIKRYVADVDRKAMTDALTHGGYPGFVTALRQAPAIGQIELGGKSFSIRWAREQKQAKGRSITIVTDTPMSLPWRWAGRCQAPGGI